MPKALPLTGLSQKAHTLSPIFSLQPQQSKWPEMHCAILVLGDISSKQVGHRGFGMLLFLLLLSSIFIFSFSVEASRLASGLGDSLGLLSPCLNRHLLARRPTLRLHRPWSQYLQMSSFFGALSFGIWLFLLLFSSLFILLDSVNASRSRLAFSLRDSLGLLSPCLNRHLRVLQKPWSQYLQVPSLLLSAFFFDSLVIGVLLLLLRLLLSS